MRNQKKKKACPAASLRKDHGINHATLHIICLQKVMTAIFWRWDFTLYPFRGCQTRRMDTGDVEEPEAWGMRSAGDWSSQSAFQRAWYQVHRTPNTPHGTMRSTPYMLRIDCQSSGVSWCTEYGIPLNIIRGYVRRIFIECRKVGSVLLTGLYPVYTMSFTHH